ncbi:hypothetical protein G3I33_27500 [Streptomyces sp. SID9124]|nr:hypothetical protein [Streptomyces sp. SID4920]MYX66694.1 hypothetical protein [Streptomyces sp. SID8373]NED15206.1 hypothetical protein [Streptomyces sp. SID9124]
MASAPPPIISHFLRLARDADASAIASQSGVPLFPGPPGPAGPQEGPPSPKLMPRILDGP